jgi:hypothetical protein
MGTTFRDIGSATELSGSLPAFRGSIGVNGDGAFLIRTSGERLSAQGEGGAHQRGRETRAGLGEPELLGECEAQGAD